MNLTSVKTVKQILSEYQVRPSRGLGQNFLIDSRAIRRLISAAHVGQEDTVLEIGPGIGTLTQGLAQSAKRVIAVEKDAKMVEILQETLKEFSNIEIVHADALTWKCLIYDIKHLKVVANLPYYITAPLIRKFLELDVKKPDPAPFLRERCGVGLRQMTLIVQKEVAQRICAKPPKMSILAVAVQVYAAPKIISYIKKTSFLPKPMVDAAILQITPFTQPYTQDFPRFFTVVKAGFKQPRKQLVNNLSKELRLPREKVEQRLLANNIQPAQRAETLSIQDWINLADML